MKFKGTHIGQASGRLAGVVYSHNRYGQYTRNGVIPVKATTEAAMNAKARFTAASQAWAALTDAQRLAWKTYAQGNPQPDAFGDPQVVTGHVAYVGNSCRTAYVGAPPNADPPVVEAPLSFLTMSATFDIGAGTTEIAFTATPLANQDRLAVWAAVVNSQGINYVENLLRLIHVSEINQATGFDYQATIEAVFGALQVDQKVVLYAEVWNATSGLVSSRLRDEGVVVTT